MVIVVAKPQRQGLNDNGDGSTMTVVAKHRCVWLHEEGGGSTTTVAAIRTDWMVVCLNLDGISTTMAAA